jgi:protein-S-isoprenylcysteine O-methyltransferase Ste14
MRRVPPAFQRRTYVHMANLALFALIIFWQPIREDIWNIDDAIARHVVWAAFVTGWLLLFMGAWSFGIGELLGLAQMRAWTEGRPVREPGLKTGWLYRWLRHPMYVGVLMGVWATPRMTFGHALLGLGLTGYVLIAMRYEERDLVKKFGIPYCHWRGAAD